ncbi:MAG: DUF6441 family protein [Micavibrio sp.]
MKIGIETNGFAVNKQLEKTLLLSKRAVQVGTKDATDACKKALRDEVVKGGLGQRLSRTWQSKMYPSDHPSYKATGFIFNKSPELIKAFTEGARIKSQEGWHLAIPTQNAPKNGENGKRISPSNWPKFRFGPLRFVYRQNGPSFLIADNLRASYSKKTGQLRGFKMASDKAKEKGRGLASVVMFLLVREVKLQKRLNPDAIVKQYAAQIPEAILKRLKGEQNG